METSRDQSTMNEPSEPNPKDMGSGVQKEKYKTITVYRDDDYDDYRATVHFEGGATASFSNLKQGIIRLEKIMDDESIKKFRVDLVGLLTIGEFDAELQAPGLTEPDPRDVANEKETRKLVYSFVTGTHNDGECFVNFLGGTSRVIRNFEDFNQVCRDLDETSAGRFMDNVNQLQQQGKLQYLLPNSHTKPYVVDEQVEQDRQAKMKELDDQYENLKKRRVELQLKGLSNFTLAQGVIDNLTEGLENNKELNPIFNELSRRGMSINITVFSHLDDDEVANLSLHPSKLFMPDMSKEEAELDADNKKFVSDCKKLMSKDARIELEGFLDLLRQNK